MTSSSARSTNLPEPRHPFARWGAVTVVACWALYVQTFSDPFNKYCALLSPGVGYLFGQTLDFILNYIAKVTSKRDQRNKISENDLRIDMLYKQREAVIKYGGDSQLLISIDSAILSFQQSNIELVVEQKRSK
jgi:hypothetical protein